MLGSEDHPLLAQREGGKRLIAYANGKVDHVNEARLKELAESKP